MMMMTTFKVDIGNAYKSLDSEILKTFYELDGVWENMENVD